MRLAMRIGTGPLQAGLNEERSNPVLAIYSSALANVYFMDLDRRADLTDVHRLAPGLLESLAEHSGIGVILVRDGSKTRLLHRGTTLLLEDAAHQDLEFLRMHDEPALVRSQLLALAAMPSAGDLLVFGAYDGRLVVNFEDHGGAHGGLGGPQMFPFMVSPRTVPFTFDEVVDATELNGFFVGRYQSNTRPSERATPGAARPGAAAG